VPVDAEYSLVQLRNGTFTIRSHAYAETMHPGIGPEAEADILYVQQTGLRERLRTHRDEFVIWDVGLGAAANALTVLHRTRSIPTNLRLISFDNTPAPLQFALHQGESLPYLASRHEVMNRLLRERQIQFTDGARQVEWEMWIDDFPRLIRTSAAETWPKPHLILFDPFSPAVNPAMWTLPLFERLFGLLAPNRECVLPTYSRSTMLRVTLLLAGFHVGSGKATGRKEETTVAANTPRLIRETLDERWLERAQRSDSAEPLRAPVYRKAPLSVETWERLRRHRQFVS
jgi:tRNA U34 5-methylaminomethyl-2-thiouridine-forming methyltransferase MnmC